MTATLTEEDLPHKYSHWCAVQAECECVLELRSAKPLEPKEVLPFAHDTCAWCDAKDADIPAGQMPTEMRSHYKGGVIIRRSPLTLAQIRELANVEKKVMEDGPPHTDTGRAAPQPEGTGCESPVSHLCLRCVTHHHTNG